ncbi:MAG: DegV family protein [Coriobacteriia bacterium]|nr:DegV family protein [Coriobacteriia bacterium]
MAVKLVIDSTNYLSTEDIARYDMRQVSLFVIDGEKHEAELDMDAQDFYVRLADRSDIPSSAQPSQGAVREAMLAILDEGHDVLGCTISADMSGTYDTFSMVAEQIKAERPDAVIELLDTRSNCMQEGYAILSAAEAAAAGKPIAECIEAGQHTIARTRFVFAPQTLEYLKRGGRIGTASALLGSALKITPILSVEDGMTVQLDKVRTFSRALKVLADKVAEDMTAADGLVRIAVHHIAEHEQAQQFLSTYLEPLVAQAREAGQTVEISPVVQIGPVIGAHVGPAVGVVYETVNPLR